MFGFQRLDRYILKQLWESFLLSVIIFSLITFFSDTFLDFLKEVQKLGLSFSTAITLIGLQLPRIIALVLPSSAFLAVLLVFNNLNKHFEIIALRMSGVSLGRLIRPALMLGVLCTVIAYVLGDLLVPYCNLQSELLKQQAVVSRQLPAGKSSFLFKQYDADHHLEKLLYIGRSKGAVVQDATILDLTRPETLQVVQAKHGHWYPERWEFGNANAYTIARKRNLFVSNHLESLSIQNFLQSNQESTSSVLSSKEPTWLNTKVQNVWQISQAIRNREQAKLEVPPRNYIRFWERITLPLSGVFLILSAVPFAMAAPRQGTDRGFLFAIGVLFLYYILRSVSVAMAQSGALSLGGSLSTPTSLMLGTWLPLILLGAIGSVLLVRKSKVL
jgi:lipopolysaccharide export system permease protein